MKPSYQIKAKANKEAEIWIYEEIGQGWDSGITAKQFAKDLKDLGELSKITLRINSPGGDVFDGIAIYNILKQHKAKIITYIDGLAASIASVIAMAGNEIFIAENAMMMIHNAFVFTGGTASDLRQMAETLEKVDGNIVTTYASRTKLPEATIKELMSAETWMSSEDAIQHGFADKLVEALDVAASFDLSRFKYKKSPNLNNSHSKRPAAIGNKASARDLRNSNLPGASGNSIRNIQVKTVGEQISSFEATRSANEARQEAIRMKAADAGRVMDDTEAEEFDGLSLKNKELVDEIKRLKDYERQIVATAKPIGEVNSESSGAGARSLATVRGPQLPKGTAFTRYAMALAKSKGNLMLAAEMSKRWKDSTPEVEQVLNVAVAAGTTTADGWASELAQYTYMASEFIEFLRPQTIIGKIPGLRTVPFNITLPLQDSGSSVGWVGEGVQKPVSKLHFDTVNFRFAKAAGIVVLTEELLRFSNPSAEALVRTDLAAAIAQFLDEQFINPTVTAVSNVSPASITNGAGTIAASGTTAADFREDLGDALTQMVNANIDPSGVHVVMQPALALALSLLRNTLGQAEFPNINASGGTIEGYPVVTSNSVPVGVVVFVKPSEILLADEGGINLDASTEASLVMDDGVSPAGTTLVSLWQKNMVALRAERIINWARRRAAAVFYITAAGYGGASPS